MTRLSFPAIEGERGNIPFWLHDSVAAWLRTNNKIPWRHQSDAWEAWHGGLDVLFTTATGSGKTLGFGVPILHTLLTTDRKVLMLYPTKALARDQYSSIQDILLPLGLESLVAVIDGDVGKTERTSVLSSARVIISNPHVLHAQLSNVLWEPLFKDLSLVVVDEIHTYSGLLGAEVAWIFRRFWRRLLTLNPSWNSVGTVIAASATLDDAEGHYLALLDRTPGLVIQQSYASAPAKFWHVYENNVSVLNQLIEKLVVQQRTRTLVYANSRSKVEQLALYLSANYPTVKVASYRSGYLSEIRKDLEQKLRTGQIDVVVTTSALAVGIDIGGIDAVILADVPPDIATLKQVAGRAGRRDKAAVICVLADKSTPMGQTLLRQNGLTQTLSSSLKASADLYNPIVMERQLPLYITLGRLSPKDRLTQSLPIRRALDDLTAKGILIHTRGEGWTVASSTTIKAHPLLVSEFAKIRLRTDSKPIDYITPSRSISEYYPGAIVTHRGRRYRVRQWASQNPKTIELDLTHETDVTTPAKFQTVRFNRSTATPVSSTYLAYIGTAGVQITVTGYNKRGRTERTKHPFDPPLVASYATRALYIPLGNEIDHAFLHALMLSAYYDLGVLPTEIGEYQTKSYFVFYDLDGPRGAVDILASHLTQLISKATTRLRNCGCGGVGCLSCAVISGCSQAISPTIAQIAAVQLLPASHGHTNISELEAT